MRRGTVLFVGVDTQNSRARDLFPRWMAELGIDASLRGVDIPLDAPPARYRELIESITSDDDIVGALITSHKLSLFAACHDLLVLDSEASNAREVNCLWKEDSALHASAQDRIAATAVLASMLGPSYWQQPAEVLCFGAGGAATAIGLSLLSGPGPRRITFTDTRAERLAALKETLALLTNRAKVDYVPITSVEDSDARLANMPPASLVINATGLGKDAPGSPISDSARFPQAGIVWELNYRGARPFLAQARSQEQISRLKVHDGWEYFLQGWFRVLSAIFGFPADAANFERLRSVSSSAG